MELFSPKAVSGYAELGWSARHWFRKRRSRSWRSLEGMIEGHEVLTTGGNGWLVVFYSYKVGEQIFSGEFRRWFPFDRMLWEQKVDEMIRRFPRGASLEVRVNPTDSTESVAIPRRT